MKVLILTPLAEREVIFYLKTLRSLQDTLIDFSQIKIYFLSFHQPSNKLIQKCGFEVLDPYSYLKNLTLSSLDKDTLLRDYSSQEIKAILNHEQLTFDLKNTEKLTEKFLRYSFVIEKILSEIETKYPSLESKHLIQELAGFIAPLSVYYACKKRKWNHWMTEPSFFKGRIHFLLNSLDLKVEKKPHYSQENDSLKLAQEKIQQFIDELSHKKQIIAASKDSHHMRDMTLKKIINSRNVKILFKKFFQKYLYHQKHEFEFLGHKIFTYFKMWAKRNLNSKKYRYLEQIPANQKIFYFPFHVQLDFALTVRSPQWIDQLGLVKKLMEYLPSDSVMVVKEHPASIGCLPQKTLDSLLTDSRFILMHPQTNSFEILNRSHAVITINSKVGAEAISLGLPVFTFGNGFYTNQGLCPHFHDWQQVKEWMSLEIKPKTDPKDWAEFLTSLWSNSFETELYDSNLQQIELFAKAITVKCHF